MNKALHKLLAMGDDHPAFTRADLVAFLDVAKRQNFGGYQDDFMLQLAQDECRYVDTDHEAELVRRGVRLGVLIGMTNRQALANRVQKERVDKGNEKKAAKFGVRDADIRARFGELSRKMKPHKAVAEIASERNMKRPRVREILRKTPG